MTQPALCEIALATADDIPLSWVARQTDDLWRADAVASYGSDDVFTSCRQLVPQYRHEEQDRTYGLVAVTGVDVDRLPRGRAGLPELSWDARDACAEGTVLATGSIGGSVLDNLHLAHAGLVVAEQHRRRGVGTLLADTMERLARADGRDTLLTWNAAPAPAAGAEVLVPPTGVGAVPVAHPAVAFLQGRGWVLEQAERHSVLPLPVSHAVLDRLWAEALPHAAGYTVRTWDTPLPDEVAAKAAGLLAHFSTEAPSAGLDWQEEAWDVERLRRREETKAAMGRRQVTTMAFHDATGDAVALTEIGTDGENEEVALQQFTVSHSQHRGHRLGMLTKVANLRHLQSAFPERRRLHTWNAGENRWMLAINDALGFQPGASEGAWQKKFA